MVQVRLEGSHLPPLDVVGQGIPWHSSEIGNCWNAFPRMLRANRHHVYPVSSDKQRQHRQQRQQAAYGYAMSVVRNTGQVEEQRLSPCESSILRVHDLLWCVCLQRGSARRGSARCGTRMRSAGDTAA